MTPPGIRAPPALRVYPPCDTAALLALPLDRKLKRLYLVAVAQFRPEKVKCSAVDNRFFFFF